MATGEKLALNIKNIKHLVLSGGGFLGISYIGLFKYLEEKKMINQIKSVTGCSAGALFGALFSLGYTSTETLDLIKSLNFKEYFNVTAESILRFPKSKGLETGNNLTDLFKSLIKTKTQDPHITFKQAHERFNIILQIGITNLTTLKFEICNYLTKPDMPVYLAIRASVAVPILFEPVIFNDCVYCDGGVIDNMPIDSALSLAESVCENMEKEFDKRQECLNSTLCIYLTNKYKPINPENLNTTTLSHFMESMLKAINSGSILHNTSNKFSGNMIYYEIPVDIMTFIKLNASNDDIDNIVEIAYTTTKAKLGD